MKKRKVLFVTLLVMICMLASNVVMSSNNIVHATDVQVTRLQWIQQLESVFQMDVEQDNYPDNYYSDLSSEDSCYKDIMIATEYGLLDVEAGDAVNVNGAVTREFAAHTLNYCLGFQNDSENDYTYTDISEVNEIYRDDFQIALNRGWFDLQAGCFNPDQYITSSEMFTMLADARKWLSSTEVDSNYSNEFSYESNVKELPLDTNVKIAEDGTMIIKDSEIKIEVGDTFVIYENSLPQAYLAKTVDTESNIQILEVEKIETKEIIKTIDAQGVVNADLTEIVPAEGTTLSIIDEDGNLVDNSQKYSLRSAKKSKTTVKLNRKIKNAKVGVVLTNLEVEYRINGINDIYVAVNGDARVSVSGNVTASQTLNLATVSVGGLANVQVDVVLSANGSVELTYDTGFCTGVQYTSGDGFRLVKEFSKKGFTVVSQIQMTAALNTSANLTNIPCVSGRLYFELGSTTKITTKIRVDAQISTCTHVLSWLYGKAGASISCTVGPWSKGFSKEVTVFDIKNSPVRIAYHYEDGKLVGECSIDPNGYYYTGADSKYGMSGTGYGIGDDGEPFMMFNYTLDEDGNATITGYKGNVRYLTIPSELDGHPVVAIGCNAFKKNDSFVSVTIPEGITSTGGSSFQECDSLQTVNLPESLTLLDNGTFYGCKNLCSINIPTKAKTGYLAGTNSVYCGPFYECSSLTDVTFNEGITTLPSALFHGCTGLKSIVLNDTITEIEGSVFSGCSNLSKVKLSDSLITINDYAFVNCISLNSIKIPETVTKIGNGVFSKCESLAHVNIPSKTETGYLAGTNSHYCGPFYECSSLNDISFNTGITKIPQGLFHGCTGLKNMELPDTVTEIAGAAFKECTSLTSIKLSNSLLVIDGGVFENCTILEKIQLPESLTKIENGAFSGCDSLATINIPAKMTTGYLSGTNSHYSGPFYNCSNLKDVTFTEGRTEIQSGMFYGCTGLEKIEIPNGIKTIEWSAFSGCTNLKDVKISEDVTKLYGGVFYGCTSLESINIPSNVISMDSEVFKGCSNLKEVTGMSGICSIPTETFMNCSMLEKVEWNNNITSVGDSAFYGCVSLQQVKIPDSVTNINYKAFYGCTMLQHIDLPQSLTEVGNYAFSGCNSLKAITLPDLLDKLGDYAFSNCEILSEVKLGASLKIIPQYCFYEDSALESIVCPYQMTTIGTNAFANCIAFKEITLNRNVTSIGTNAFSYLDKLTINGVEGTYAETYAKENSINFNALSNPTTKIEFGKEVYRVARGKTAQIVTKLTPEDTSDELVMMSLDENIVTVSEDGVITGVAVGTAKILVMSGSVSEYCDVEVYEKVTGVKIDTSSKKLSVGEKYQLVATVSPKNATDKTVRWESDNPSVVSVDENGLITARDYGTAKVSVITFDGNYTATCEIEVSPVTVTSVSLNMKTVTIGIEETVTLLATVLPENAGNKKIIWSTSDSSIAIVENGVVTGVSEGTVHIIAKTEDGSKTALCEVTVVNKVDSSPAPTLVPTGTPTPTPAVNSTASPIVNSTARPTVTPSKTTVLPTTSSTVKVSVNKPSKVQSVKMKNKKKGRVTVTWKKCSGTSCYEVQYCTNKKFKNKKCKTTKKNSITIKKLKRKKVYYVRVRAYRFERKRKIYGNWSTVKKITIKK